jgi:hypothetical protein
VYKPENLFLNPQNMSRLVCPHRHPGPSGPGLRRRPGNTARASSVRGTADHGPPLRAGDGGPAGPGLRAAPLPHAVKGGRRLLPRRLSESPCPSESPFRVNVPNYLSESPSESPSESTFRVALSSSPVRDSESSYFGTPFRVNLRVTIPSHLSASPCLANSPFQVTIFAAPIFRSLFRVTFRPPVRDFESPYSGTPFRVAFKFFRVVSPLVTSHSHVSPSPNSESTFRVTKVGAPSSRGRSC